jgi:hypothetical protein
LSKHWVDLFSGLHLTSWEEGAKGPEGKSKLVKDKSLRINLEMLRPWIPEKAIKIFSARNKRDPKKNNKTRPNQRIGGLITSQPIRFMGI